MLAKMIRTRRDGLTARAIFASRVGYCCGKASAISSVNLAGDWRDAPMQMAVSAGLNPALRDPSCHFVLSWADGENPRDAEIIAAARIAVRALGASLHQYVTAVHRNRPNVHAHVVLNRVHPLSGKVLSLSHDYARLELACRKIEHRFGWPPDRGRFDHDVVEGEVILVPKAPAHWNGKRADRAAGLRPDPRGVLGSSLRTGRMPLRDRMTAERRHAARTAMRSARDWIALHARLLRLGLRYLARDAGARITEDTTGDWMPACQLGSEFAMPRLVARLGCFVSAPGQPDRVRAPRSAERRRYDAARETRRANIAALQLKYRDERQRLGQLLKGMPRTVASAFLQVLREDQNDDLTRLRKIAPLPRLRADGVDSAVGTKNPAREWALRYRHGLRRTGALRDGFMLAQTPPDHTRLRQIWHKGFRLSVDEDHAADLRALGNGFAMIARRGSRGDLLGYDLVRELPGRGLCNLVPEHRPGLGSLGDPRARICIVVADAAAGMRVSAASADALVIIVSETPSLRQAAQIAALIGPRRAVVVVECPKTQAGFLEQMTTVLPAIGVIELSDSPGGVDAEPKPNADLPTPSPLS